MTEWILTLLHGIFLLLFGIMLTAAFSGIHPTKGNKLLLLSFFAGSGLLQLAAMLLLSEEAVWKLYPVITHLPLLIMVCLVFRKPIETAAVAILTAYMCCQPSTWFGVLAGDLTASPVAELTVRIACLVPSAYIAVRYLAPYLSKIFGGNRPTVWILSAIPAVYYVFSYMTAVYTNLWLNHARVLVEFLPFFLAVCYTAFCVVYDKACERAADAQRKEHIIRIAVEQQEKEINAVKQMEKELQMLRHDMRMLLSSLAVSIENGETDTALEMINGYTARIDSTRLRRYCGSSIINYVISDYAARCEDAGVLFQCTVELDEITLDEIMFSSILSNALDNALNAQEAVPVSARSIRLMLKHASGKLLMSVKNPVAEEVAFRDGLPVSEKDRQNYGSQSIRYLTERLGGNCQFAVQDGIFSLRVVL